MTDQQNYTDPLDGTRLRITPIFGGGLSVRTMTEGGSGITVEVPTEDLLAMIDIIAPDAMRAYLRERSDYLDSPLTAEELSSRAARMQADADARAADRLDAAPEADSPEDVDEMPNIEQAIAAGEQIGNFMRAFRDAYHEAMKR